MGEGKEGLRIINYMCVGRCVKEFRVLVVPQVNANKTKANHFSWLDRRTKATHTQLWASHSCGIGDSIMK